MLFFIFGIKSKIVGKEERKIQKNGFDVNAIITIYKNYFELFFIPIFPIGKKYSMYIPHSDEYYENGNFGNMPQEYLMLCKEVGEKY
ncbi:hypothetical protein G6R40_12525 [Chryseobacterium sp. POL2]|uniref:hypothetical protein n=1 Tax=Chryseobacterium sp. POL2 TaxID=2713414 RepID=UPI0013E15B2C|nr:hypothetical protein [Chryseobacterium sp. POL2]QIG90429.1 hypothetical protein G6R40_12525 [Chryseobacterium sp. POL2]